MWAKLPKVCVTCPFWDKKTLFFSSLGLIPAPKRASCLVRRRRGDGTTRHSVGTTRHLGFPVRHFVGTTRHFVLGAVHDRLPPRCRSGWGGGRGGDVQGGEGRAMSARHPPRADKKTGNNASHDALLPHRTYIEMKKLSCRGCCAPASGVDVLSSPECVAKVRSVFCICKC